MTPRPREDSLSTITTVVFDYGEVLAAPPPKVRSRLEELSGVPAEQFWDAYWKERRAYDSGLDSREYWNRVGARLNISWDSVVRQELWATDVAGWLVPALDAVTLAAQLTASPLQVALLSNAPHDLAGPLRFSPLLRGFDALFFSCEIGLCKPDSRVYEHVLRELGAAPHETLFIDDREDNIRAAATLGIRVHHYTGAAGLAALLQQLPLG